MLWAQNLEKFQPVSYQKTSSKNQFYPNLQNDCFIGQSDFREDKPIQFNERRRIENWSDRFFSMSGARHHWVGCTTNQRGEVGNFVFISIESSIPVSICQENSHKTNSHKANSHHKNSHQTASIYESTDTRKAGLSKGRCV